MLFNSFDFAVFFPIVFALFWFFQNNLRLQNWLIVISSYVFYGWWDWRFLSLIFLSTIVDFIIGHKLGGENSIRKRNFLLLSSLVINLGILFIFKYYNFFLDNLAGVFSLFGYSIEAGSLRVVLPVGISFYTFQTLSYTIDVYRKKMNPVSSLLEFAAFVCFFPQLVAGPIERAGQLLPQFGIKKQFHYESAVDGLRQILWGLFKKMVVADNCAIIANMTFGNPSEYNGSALLVGAICFAFQIYGDFSGYSDIAIGSARLLGFNLMQNFAFPYFSRDIAEFWRRWHISLSTWFRDYVYIPLGGSKGTMMRKIFNVFVIFLLSGLWHGANWTFIVWGAINAFFFIPLMVAGKNRQNLSSVAASSSLPSMKEMLGIVMTFAVTCCAWIVFRAETLGVARSYFEGIFSYSVWAFPNITGHKTLSVFAIAFCVLVEWFGRFDKHGLEKWALNWPTSFRWSFYVFLVILIFAYSGVQQQFIYFQF